MTEAYNDALGEQVEANVWRTMREEAVNMPRVQKVQLAADIAGIFDPTPISDGVGAVASAMQGDVWGVGFSLLGMIPYVGDLGKVGKISRIAPRTGRALDALFRHADNLAAAGRTGLRAAGLALDQVAAARKAAMERVQAAMQQARRGNRNCADCAKLGRQKVSRMPHDKEGVGRWRNGRPNETGTGTFDFDPPKTIPDPNDPTKTLEVRSIDYQDGFPVFDQHVVGGKHNLWEVSGDAATDGRALTRQMRENTPGWRPPDGDDYVLHHFQDGQVGYVPRTIHDNGRGYTGASHTGADSMMETDLF